MGQERALTSLQPPHRQPRARIDRHRFEPRRGRPSIKLSREPVFPRKAIFGEIIGGAAQDHPRRLLPPRQRLRLPRLAPTGTDRTAPTLPVALVRPPHPALPPPPPP